MLRRSAAAGIVGIVMCAVLLAACGSSSPSAGPSSSGPLVVAVEGPMTGTQASNGQDMLRGGQLAAARLNAAGGVMGRQVKIVAADDGADPTKGASVANQVIAEHAAAVVGPFNSAVGTTALPVYKAAGVSILRMTSATDTEGFGVTTQPMVTQIAPVEAKALTDMTAHSVAILYDPSSYTAGITDQLVSLLKKAGVRVPVDQVLKPTAPASKIQAALSTVGAAAPDVTYLAMYGPEAGTVAKAMATQPSDGRCFVDLAAQGPTFIHAAGTAAASRCVASGVPAAAELPGGAAYVSAYRAKFQKAPGTWGAFVYDSVGIWAAAVKKSHQDFGATVRAALATTSTFSGVTGTTTFLPKTGNRANPPVVILQISLTGKYSVDPAWAAAAGYHTSGTG